MCKKQVTFLLGSGCEGKNQLELPSGVTFKRDTIFAENVAELVYAINFKKQPEIINGSIITHRNSSILYQTIREHGLDSFRFSRNDKKIIEKYLELKNSNRGIKKEKDISKKFSKIYNDKFFKVIKENNYESMSENVRFFLNNACFYAFVDSQFNYLRKPELYKEETNRVIKLYYAAYLCIIRHLFNDDENQSFEKIINSHSSIINKRKALAALVQSAQKRIFDEKHDKKYIYYNMIKEFIRKHTDYKIGIVTTNYTEFAQTFTGITPEHMSFVHGKLDLFESVNSKLSDQLTAFPESEFVFPFIFIQSGIKPIVNSKQISELGKAAQMIENADELYVLGYGINTDDEHITNLLRERLHSGKKITCFLHGNKSDELKKQESVEKELGCNSLLCFLNDRIFEESLNTL